VPAGASRNATVFLDAKHQCNSLLEHGLRDVVGVPVDGQLAAAARAGASGLPILADRPQAPV